MKLLAHSALLLGRVIVFCSFAELVVPAGQAQDSPVIRVNTRLVQVDTIVRNKDGPVANLTGKDFTVLDNGKPQKIAVFAVRSNRRASGKVTPLPPGTVSNRLKPNGEEPETATVVLWDATNTETKDQASVRGEVLKYLATRKAGDPIALYSMAKTLRVIEDFTGDPERLIRAVHGTRPEQSTNLAAADLGDLASSISSPNMRAMLGPTALVDNAEAGNNAVTELEDYVLRDRAYLTEACLVAIAQHLSGMPGRKKLIWISGSFPAISKDARGNILDFSPQIDNAVRKLNNANVAVYPIDPRVMATGEDLEKFKARPTGQGFLSVGGDAMPGGLSMPNIDTMNLLAAGTGGRASYASNDIAGALRGVMEDDEVTYTLGFYAANEKLDGAYHSISVKVDRKDVEVRSRKGYFGVDVRFADEGEWREVLNESMQNPLEATSLGLRAVVTPVERQPGMYNLEVTVDLSDVHFEHEKDLWVALISYATRFSPSDSTKGTLETIRISLTEKRLREALKDGYVFRRMIEAGDRKGNLRVAVEDRTTGELGSVVIPLGTNPLGTN